jgi:endonuclease/exonuclease/phosphatase family metal-dependent hydrolase
MKTKVAGTDGFTRRSTLQPTDGFTRRSTLQPTDGFTRRTATLALACFMLLILMADIARAQTFKVMTFNIRFDNPADGINSWENRRKLVTLSLRNASPDFIGMQEVLERQAIYLKANLPGYEYVGVGRDDGKTGGEYVPIFYRSDRFKILDWGTFWLSPTPADTASVGWDAALTRICTWGKFLDKSTNSELFFLNTHFDHIGLTARAESARLIIDFINKKTEGLPVILTGDFNCSPEDEPYKILTEGSGLTDACVETGTEDDRKEGTFNGFGNETHPERIDLVLFNDAWNATSYAIRKVKYSVMFISDHWPVLVEVSSQQSAVNSQQSAVSGQSNVSINGDTTLVQTFTFDSIVTRRAIFQFPGKDKRYEKILMFYTLKCDSLTPHDKYPCGEWDYTTYTRVFHPTGKYDSVKYTQSSFVVKGKSPKTYLYTTSPSFTYFLSPIRDDIMVEDHFARFEGADYITVPGEAFRDVRDEITVSFWLNGDPFHQPMASTIFEGLDSDGKRVINLHVPYDNGVVYWDAGGHGDGLTDNIYRTASPQDYKGRWTHWTVTKNSKTGEQRIYLNGELFQKGTGLSRTMDGISTFRIGSNGMGNAKFYRGSLDDFTVWGRELDSLEIISLYRKSFKELPEEGMLFAYDFDDISKFPVIPDLSSKGNHGSSFGNPSFISYRSLPYLDFKQADPMTTRQDSIQNPKIDIVLYSDSLNPSRPTDTLHAWPGYNYYCNSQGIVIDSVPVKDALELQRKTRTWYGDPYEITEQFEIGRFITPYGKRLDLGLNGFTWVYDVTDYEPLLHGKVDLQAANGQELLDLKFLFIEGTPPRDIISVRNIWPEGSYEYKELAVNEELQAASFKLQDAARSFKLRARISGHGHYGPYNCCEWDPKTHTYIINGEERFDWKVWRDCGMNPVYPQGGTWQFDRAGWCPGTFVDTYDFEITPFVQPGNTVTIDYQIQPYDPDNGEEGGNYEMAMHLFEYSAPNYHLDLEMNDILAPSTRQEYRRMNPVSLNPVIRVKNNGTDTVFSFTVVYGLEGNPGTSFDWAGKLGFMQFADIILPKPSWEGLDEKSRFEAKITSVNGKTDETESNNKLSSDVEKPVFLPEKFYIQVKTQGFGRAADNAYTITDASGKIVSERKVYSDTTLYQDLVKLKPGAYDFTFTDKNEDGMIRHWWLYWEDPEKVGENGELKILDADKKESINLGYDFAEKRTLQFFVGEPK